MALTFPVAPMKAAIGNLPPASQDDQWAYEIKWDGYRTLAFVRDGAVRLQSSTGIDVTGTYPELAGFAEAVNAGSAIVDGELVVLDAEGRPNFGMLQRHQTQVAFYAFDVLQIDGTDCTALPYEQRRALLTAMVEVGPNWMVPAHRVGDGAALLAASAAQGLEGVMAKRLGSPYQPGRRSPNWRKVKNRQRLEVVVGGFGVGTGSRSTTFGSLLVGLPEADRSLRFCGAVGTGFTQARLEALAVQLRGLAQRDCPFSSLPPRSYLKADVTWVRPELRAIVEIAEITNDGFIRHPSFIDLV
ncbi:MAG: non-homologous end-joining DNA ligase [Ilumatobacteraceae bacterium]|nr:non-homologous end-joining DNA ligase [Ilumatobacteraceae bacterium]